VSKKQKPLVITLEKGGHGWGHHVKCGSAGNFPYMKPFDTIDVIEYTPEVKRAVELRTELVEQLQTVLDSYRVSVSPEESFIKKALITDTKNLINRAKGQA
jgi:hypothetical protein